MPSVNEHPFLSPGSMVFEVTIDGEPNTLTYQSYSGSRGHQYLTRGNVSSFGFLTHPEPGQRFKWSGHDFVILRRVT